MLDRKTLVWSQSSTIHVYKNYGDIQALQLASKNKKLKSEERAMAIGQLHQMKGD